MNNDELIEYAIRTSKVIKAEIKPKLIDYFYQNQERMKYLERSNNRREDTIFEKNQKISDLEDKLSKIETLIINHNCDTGDIYYKYNSKFLKSELKQRILEIVYEEESDSNVKD